MGAENVDAFKAELGRLCAAYDRPLTPERESAFRTGLSKLPLPAFSRVVDDCLSEHGPERMPSVRECWSIYKRLRSSHVRHDLLNRAEPELQISDSLCKVNLMFFTWLRIDKGTRKATLPQDEMQARREACRELAEAHEQLLRERDPEATYQRLGESFARAMASIPRQPRA